MEFGNDLTGADAQRLADCIKFAGEHNLTITKHTQAGLNPGSGNVWLWDEDWPACVYTSIAFDTAFSWSCPNCGEEYDEETVAGCEDRNTLFNLFEGCHECKEEEMKDYTQAKGDL